MNKVEEIQANLFSECKSILENLAKVETKEVLIAQKQTLHLLMEKVSHIEFLENNRVWIDAAQPKNDETEAVSVLNELSVESNEVLEIDESETLFVEVENDSTSAEEDIENETVEEEMVQEVLTTQVSWETEQGEEIALEDESKPIDENPSDDAYENGEESVCLGGLESSISEKIEASEEENVVLFSGEDLQISEEGNLSLSFENKDITGSISLDELVPKEEIVEEQSITIEENISVTEGIQAEEEHPISQEEQHHEKKIKLPHIKGLKTVQTLFDDEVLAVQPTTPSVTEVSQDIKPSKTPFKLDLNDRIAFSKMLFGGSQMELNEVVNQLNHFETLDEAKEFLSDMYYEKDWEKVDEYAQRLWILVENKFM